MTHSTSIERGRRAARRAFLPLFTAFASTLLTPAVVQAATAGPITVSLVGIQGNQLYVASPDIPAACGGYFYLSLANSSYNASYVMSLVLSARLTNKPISRVDYTPGNPCFIDLVQL